MKLLLRSANNSYSNSPKALLVGDIPIKETTADITKGHLVIFAGTFNYTTEHVFKKYVEDEELTKMSMSFSENSLKEVWDNDADDRWDDFLK